jgi:hypothetical protein
MAGNLFQTPIWQAHRRQLLGQSKWFAPVAPVALAALAHGPAKSGAYTLNHYYSRNRLIVKNPSKYFLCLAVGLDLAIFCFASAFRPDI